MEDVVAGTIQNVDSLTRLVISFGRDRTCLLIRDASCSRCYLFLTASLSFIIITT